jgi:hypothetical protein
VPHRSIVPYFLEDHFKGGRPLVGYTDQPTGAEIVAYDDSAYQGCLDAYAGTSEAGRLNGLIVVGQDGRTCRVHAGGRMEELAELTKAHAMRSMWEGRRREVETNGILCELLLRPPPATHRAPVGADP